MGEARYELRSLVSRDAAALDQSLASAAAIESVAENTTDSYIGPWLAFALLGLPGAFAFRAVNTLDSMIGYRGRYEYLGKASARLDDAMNLIPARISAAMMLAAGALCRLPAGRGWRWALTGRRLTASPNAGWTIGAMSGLLGVALEKSGHYRIGEGLREPGPGHIGASIRVAYARRRRRHSGGGRRAGPARVGNRVRKIPSTYGIKIADSSLSLWERG